MPFVAFDASLTGVLGTSAQSLSVSTWDKVNQAYVKASMVNGAWVDAKGVPSTISLVPGEGFIIQNGTTITQTVVLAGHVVLNPEVTVPMYPGLNLFGFPYSSRAEAKDLTLPVDANQPLVMGVGYWYDRSGEVDVLPWTETIPYANPFPANSEPPLITALAMDAAGQMVLTAACAGNETFDILVQDVTDSAFTGQTGWKVAAKGLAPNGAKTIAWTDPANDLAGRYYLVARGDIDIDGDGLTDATELFVYGTNPTLADSDGDGVSDSDERLALATQNSGGRFKVVIVDAKIGSDKFDGHSAKVLVGKNGATLGPKATIKGGQKVLKDGGTLLIQSGSYSAEGIHSFGGSATVVISGTGVVSL
jgi:hypothetical protein